MNIGKMLFRPSMKLKQV